MFGADFGTSTNYSREVESKFLQKLSGGKICSVPYGTKMTKAITKWEIYKIYWSIFDLSVLYLRMVLTVRSKQNNHDYSKMKTKNKQTRGLEEPTRFFWRLQLFSVKLAIFIIITLWKRVSGWIGPGTIDHFLIRLDFPLNSSVFILSFVNFLGGWSMSLQSLRRRHFIFVPRVFSLITWQFNSNAETNRIFAYYANYL